MSDPTPISAPAGYAPAVAIGFADPDTYLSLVSDGRRLPVAVAAPASAPLAGETSASQLVGPFVATAGRVLSVTLKGDWQGTAQLLRSTDNGTTKSPLRVGGEPWGVYTTSGCEQAWAETEEAASYYLDIALTSGTVAYRVSQ